MLIKTKIQFSIITFSPSNTAGRTMQVSRKYSIKIIIEFAFIPQFNQSVQIVNCMGQHCLIDFGLHFFSVCFYNHLNQSCKILNMALGTPGMSIIDQQFVTNGKLSCKLTNS